MAGFWYTVNSFTANLFRGTIIHGPGHHITDPGYITTTCPWWDQRGIRDATEPEQPQSIDYTDLSALGWTPEGHG